MGAMTRRKILFTQSYQIKYQEILSSQESSGLDMVWEPFISFKAFASGETMKFSSIVYFSVKPLIVLSNNKELFFNNVSSLRSKFVEF